MRGSFSAQVLQAVNEQRPNLAREIYEKALALPQTETEKQLEVVGYILNGQLHVGNESLVMCHKGTKPC
jgi:hypothetical protein